MLTYLFDASAAVEIYVPRNEQTKRAVRYILEQKNTYNHAVLFIPSICIAEVFNTLARKHFKPRDQNDALDRENYQKHLGRFREHVHWGRTLYPYDVSRYHIIAADKIIPVEHDLASKDERDHLSTFDILVIAMACELAYIGRPEDTFLVTCDHRMKRVFEELKKSDPDTVVEAERVGLRLARRATPLIIAVETVAIRVMLREPDQILFRLPFLPAGFRGTDNKEVRRMEDAQSPSVGALVVELERGRLIVVFEYRSVVLHLVDSRQLDPVTFKLDGDAHLSARITTAHVRHRHGEPGPRTGCDLSRIAPGETS